MIILHRILEEVTKEPTTKMMRLTILLAALVGISVAEYAGGIFPMSKGEVATASDLLRGLDMAVEKLNMKNDRKENEYRFVNTLLIELYNRVC